MCFVFSDNMDDKHDNTANFLDSKLLYPEVLEESDLLLMLKERHVPVEMQELRNKVSLVNLCHKNIVPRPQRNYRSNRRGQVMKQQQIKLYGESSSNLTVLNKNNFKGSIGDRLKPPPTDGRLKLLADSDKIKLPQSMDRLKLSGDRLKPPPCSDRLKPSPAGDRIKPPLPVTPCGPTENKVIRLSNHCTLAPGTYSDEPSNKRSAAVEDDKSPPSKRIHLGSSTASLNQGVGTDKSHEQSKDSLNNSGKSEDGSSKKFTEISWP